MHDEAPVRGHDVEISRLADHRLGNVAEHPGVGEAYAARKDSDHPLVLGKDRRRDHQHHVRVADIGEERLRDDGLLSTNGVPHVSPIGSMKAASIGAIRTLGEHDALGGKQEGGTVHRGVQARIGVQISLCGVRISDVGLGDLDGAERQRPLQGHQLLVQIIGDTLYQGVLFLDQHAHQLLAERIHRCHTDRHDGAQEDYRDCGRGLGRELPARAP